MQELQLSLQITCPENILWWMICVGLIGSIITGVMMLQAGRFTVRQDGLPVSIQKFHLLGSAAKANVVLDNMNQNARKSMRRGIRADFWYMPFFYGLMICISVLIYWRAPFGTGWKQMLEILCWVPLACWVCDVLEDVAAVSILNGFDQKRVVSRGTTVLMTIASALKWITGIAWLLILISRGVAWVVGG